MATFRKRRSRKYRNKNTRINRRSKKSLVGGLNVRRLLGLSSGIAPSSEPAPSSVNAPSSMIVKDSADDDLQQPKTSDIPLVNSRIKNLTDDIYKTLIAIQTDNNAQNNDNKLQSLMMIKRYLESLEGIKLSLSKSYDKGNLQVLYNAFKTYEDAILNIISINTEQERLTHIKNISDTLSRIEFKPIK